MLLGVENRMGGMLGVCWLTVSAMNRAFADFVLGSLILHFFCVNFIN